jgi:hypothetical protein
VTGTGTGSNIEVTGTGTGSNIQVTGTGTGSNTLVTGTGTGSTILVTGTGTGTEALTITLPSGTGMNMEVSLGCGSAGVSIVDNQSVPIVSFANVAVIGNAGFCDRGQARDFGAVFRADPGFDFRSE